ncbi:hypothetical protein N7450_011567 [Penicillium hetheringtonii]|uniref:Uncharacterized protein n=1 Tax=Penicillium hetheringtonii TaxID=911720 RepID=A0AAD6DA69_9EURO|nr:hypothetical protein N7450_011567 [Penicillium hetheringtonii]
MPSLLAWGGPSRGKSSKKKGWRWSVSTTNSTGFTISLRLQLKSQFSPGNMRGLSYSTLCGQPVEAIHKGTEHTPTQSDRTNTRPPPPMHDESDPPLTQHVEIRFWSLERGEWNQSDFLLIDRSDPSPVERVARNIRLGHCYRAASVDGSNAIFVISAHEEDQLAGAGGLGQVKQLVSMASKAVAGTVGR